MRAPVPGMVMAEKSSRVWFSVARVPPTTSFSSTVIAIFCPSLLQWVNTLQMK